MKKNRKQFVKPGAGVFMLNQHAPKFGDRRTKRNRTKAEQKRRAIAEQD